MNILAIDIGGTMIKYGLVSSDGEILSTDKIETEAEKGLENILNIEIGLTFSRVLEDAGVFKRDEKGKNAFLKFINHIGGRF